MAGYTGVLLSVTNRPVWTETNLLGLVFLLSGTSTGAALIILLARGWRWMSTGIDALKRLDSWVLGAELIALIALVVTVGGTVLSHIWLNWWGLLLLVGVFLLGIVIPLILEIRPHTIPEFGVGAAAVLVLIGGFLLRVVMLLSPETIRLASGLVLPRVT